MSSAGARGGSDRSVSSQRDSPQGPIRPAQQDCLPSLVLLATHEQMFVSRSDETALSSVVENGRVRISAKADYAVRAAVELAAAGESEPVKSEAIAEAQQIPPRFLENILGELRHSGLVQSRRGAEGGYRLSRAADDITIAEVIRAVDGPLATVRGDPADELEYDGTAVPLQEVWLALRANIRRVLETVTLAAVVEGDLPPQVRDLATHPEAGRPR
jgi:Rrf2 family protein